MNSLSKKAQQWLILLGLLSCREEPQQYQPRTPVQSNAEQVKSDQAKTEQTSTNPNGQPNQPNPQSPAQTDSDPDGDNLGESTTPAPSTSPIPGTGTTPVIGKLTVSWTAPATTEAVTGYKVFAGLQGTTSFVMVHEVASADAGFDLTSPKIVLTNLDTGPLAALSGKTGCFYLVAKNAQGDSDPSDQVCIQL